MSVHAIERIAQHYNLRFEMSDILKYIQLIKDNDPRTILLKDRGEKGSWYAIRFDNTWIMVVYENETIITAYVTDKLIPYRKILRARKKELREMGLEEKKKINWKKIK